MLKCCSVNSQAQEGKIHGEAEGEVMMLVSLTQGAVDATGHLGTNHQGNGGPSPLPELIFLSRTSHRWVESREGTQQGS